MHEWSQLRTSALPGFLDLLRTALEVGHNPLYDRVMRFVWGLWARTWLTSMAILCALVGFFAHGWDLRYPFSGTIYLPGILFGFYAAWRIRTALFDANHYIIEASEKNPHFVFQAIAWPMVPATILLIGLGELFRYWIAPATQATDPMWVGYTVSTLVIAESFFRCGAVVAIIVSVLCHRRSGLSALWELLLTFIFFTIALAVARIVLEAVSPARLLSVALDAFTGAGLPAEFVELTNQAGVAACLILVFAAVVGGIWMVSQAALIRVLNNGFIEPEPGLLWVPRADENEERQA